MKLLLVILPIFITVLGFSQNTMTSTGTWNTPSRWSSNNVADNVNEDASISTNINATLPNSLNITVGNVNLVGNNTLTISNNSTLNLGNSTNQKSLTTGMNANLIVKGTLIIWGDFIANSNINIDMSGGGNIIIHGKLKLNGNTNITMSGGSFMEIWGDFEGTYNNNVSLNGSNSTVLVHGNVNVEGGSNLNPGAGSFQYGGNCTDGNSNFCNNATKNGALPIQLLSFIGYVKDGKPVLEWVTATEKNNHYFVISRYDNGETWEVDRVDGAGDSNEPLKYQWTDESSNLTGKLYYRLSQVDYDGQSEAFNMVVVDMNTKVIEGFVVSDQEEVVAIQYFDEMGRVTTKDKGFRIVRMQTNRGLYIRKENIINF